MNRGDIWWASLPDPSVSSPGYRRPVLIVQSNPFNISLIQTIIVVALTTNLKLVNAPGNILIGKQHSGLPRDSVINISQIITINKGFLTEYVNTLPARHMRKVDEGLRLVLSLS